MRAALPLFLVCASVAWVAPSSEANAQGGGLVVWLSHDPSLASHVPAVRRGLRRALPGARQLGRGGCEPSGDAPCVVTLLERSGATRLLVVRVFSQRGCVPMLRDGEVVGRRMLRDDVVALQLYAADGAFLGSETVPIEEGDLSVAVRGGAEVLLARWPHVGP